MLNVQRFKSVSTWFKSKLRFFSYNLYSMLEHAECIAIDIFNLLCLALSD